MTKGMKTGGRHKGTPNKTTAAVKTAVLKAFEDEGGAEYLRRVAKEDPRTFCSLLGRLLPMEVGGDGEPVRFTVITGVPQPESPPVVRPDGNGGHQ